MQNRNLSICKIIKKILILTLLTTLLVKTLKCLEVPTLKNASSYPNPYKPNSGHDHITFEGLVPHCTIYITTLDMSPVVVLEEIDADGRYSWDAKNSEGVVIPDDIYYVKIVSLEDQTTFFISKNVGGVGNIVTKESTFLIAGDYNMKAFDDTALMIGEITIRILHSSTKIVTIDSSTVVEIMLPSGKIEINVPAGAFSETVNMTISTTTPTMTDRDTIKVTGVGLEVTTDRGLQPLKDVTITISYRDSDVVGLDETKLVIGRYDDINRRWIPLCSTTYPEQNKVVAKTRYLSRFAILQLLPASNLNMINVFPNPYNPRKNVRGLTIEGITATAKIKIYTIVGELVRELDESDGDGRVIWDGKNDNGKEVASGVYIGYIEGTTGTRKIKIAIEK